MSEINQGLSAPDWAGAGWAGGTSAGPPTLVLPRATAPPALGRAAPPDPGSADDAALVARSRRGDREAFEELVRRTARLVFARLYLETGDVHRAEDLVQETYLVAWRSIAQVTDASGFRAWLLTVARSVWVDAGRRESRKKRSGPAAAGDPAETLAAVSDARPDPAEAAVEQEDQQRALEMLRSLPEEYRLPLSLRYLGGADYETIGRQLGLSNGSLRGLLHRGLNRLRELMGAGENKC